MNRIRAMLTLAGKEGGKGSLAGEERSPKIHIEQVAPENEPHDKGSAGETEGLHHDSQDAEPEGKINVGNVAVGRVGPKGAKNRYNGRHGCPRSAHKKPDEPFPGIGADQYKKHPGKEEGHGNLV